jgi:hypothetical protein
VKSCGGGKRSCARVRGVKENHRSRISSQIGSSRLEEWGRGIQRAVFEIPCDGALGTVNDGGSVSAEF